MSIMAIHAEAVEILVRKGHFEPEVALGIAEAIEASINLTQVVTVPLLDARLQELRHDVKSEFAEVRMEMATLRTEMAGEFGKQHTEMATLRGDMLSELQRMRAETAAEFGRMRAETAAEFGKMRAETAKSFGEVAGKFGEILAKTNADKADLMRWVLFTMLSSILLSMAGKYLMTVFGY